MTSGGVPTAADQIRNLLSERAAAISARDARRAVADYASGVVSFGLAPTAGRSPTSTTPRRSTWMARAEPPLT
jgi:hypothetical protein